MSLGNHTKVRDIVQAEMYVSWRSWIKSADRALDLMEGSAKRDLKPFV